MIWLWIFIAGVVTFLTRYSLIAFINPKTLSDTSKKVLTYVPSAVFPAIIFPAVFLDKNGFFVSIENPQVWAFILAILVGYYFKNIILTIISGLVGYWAILFLLT